MTETHVIEHNGQEYQVIEVGKHPHAHGGVYGHEKSGESSAAYRCFECGTRVTAETLDEAKAKLKQKSCDS